LNKYGREKTPAPIIVPAKTPKERKKLLILVGIMRG
ncbi:MAG: hypothetical protein G01um101419_856, partial [Parcubacteria group bacterium Gr01-1014_19]